MRGPLEVSATALEAAGAGIMQRITVPKIGVHLSTAGASLLELAQVVPATLPNDETAQLAGQRMTYAGEQMVLAGNNLQGIQPKKPKGKSWLKG